MAKKEDKFFEDGVGESLDNTVARHPNRNEDKSRERTKPDGRRNSVAKKILTQADATGERDNHVRASQESQQHFFVLILSKKQAKLFRGDLLGLKHIEISELPNGIEDVVHIEEKDQKLFRTAQSGRGNVHGVGAGVPSEKENISMYLKEVDQTLWKEGLNKENAPLVLGGVEYIVAIYKDISQYKHITDKALTGSLENEDPKEIYRRAKEIVSPTVVG
jgi:hypothetical protein